MSIRTMIAFLTGYLTIWVQGEQLEKFINLATGCGLPLWKVSRVDETRLTVKLGARGFGRIRKVARISGCTVRICQKSGWPFLARRIAARKSFLAGAIACAAALFYLSSFILFIRVDGLPRSEWPRMVKMLKSAGLQPGKSRGEIQKQREVIEKVALLHAPDLVWLGIHIHGVVAQVKAVPRKAPPSMGDCVNLIAACDGVVTKVVVIRGIPWVKEGDTVVRGQLLISGTQMYQRLQSGETYLEKIPASGMVEARVWEKLTAWEPLSTWRASFQPGGRYVSYQLKIGKRCFTVFGPGRKSRRHFTEKRYYKPIYRGRNPSEDVELIKNTMEVVTWKKIRRPLAAVRRSAMGEVDRKRKILGYRAFSAQNCEWNNEGKFLRLQVTFERVRDIAKAVPR